MLRLNALRPLGLEPVSLELPDGGCLAVTGPSGAGKTLLLRAIADLDDNQGDAETSSLRRSKTPAPRWRRAVAYVPAESGWWSDHVGHHMPASDPDLSVLSDLGLDSQCLEWAVARLSTGEKQRLALARALLTGPDVLLLDEPTSALDSAATAAVETVLKEKLAAGATVVIVTHDVDQATRLGARMAHVQDGRLALDETPTST